MSFGHDTSTLAAVAAQLRCTVEQARGILQGIETGSNKRKALILADLHVPNHDMSAINAALDACSGHQITDVIILGDLLECDKLSSWLVNPSSQTVAEELSQATALLDYIGSRFPGARQVIIEGNHELRLKTYLWKKAPALSSIAALTVPNLLGITDRWEYISVTDLLCAGQPPPSLGGLFLLHGHELNISDSAKDALERAYYRAHFPVLVAHRHQSLEFSARRIDSTYARSWCVGCLCSIFPEYRPVNDWCHGCAIVTYTDTEYAVDNIRLS